MGILDRLAWLNGATLLIVLVLVVLTASFAGLLVNQLRRRSDHDRP